ncbi:hypothetical protein ALC62_14030 [Cyphomyrmex costatus]|uniref:Myb/SANT-like DNA-binding domain-containing protein n=1 Tax=Cyphomyrmex costatus TaxID=456900 RepID=A0A151I950_9HYME|nr:hypothetical protein ALC62_14030 [Cyphomyrmex costatus]
MLKRYDYISLIFKMSHHISYKVIEGPDGAPIFDITEMSKVLLHDKITGKIDFISVTDHILDVLKPYGFKMLLPPEKDAVVVISSDCTSHSEETENIDPRILKESNGRTLNKEMKNMWTDKSRAMLLHLYKKYKCDFDSNIKKDDVWTKITCDMKCEGYNFSATQCKEKMKYMKKSTLKK